MEEPSWMANVTHRNVKIDTNGINMHFVEQGTGPTVLLLHGFPVFWYSWRFQIPALAEAGFHVVAPDMRGAGQTDAPESSEVYTSFHIVGDLVGLLDALGKKRVFVVGHDWGAIIAWDLCLLRPDRVEAVFCLSVPFIPRMPVGSLLQTCAQAFGEGFYMCRFQEPGRAERDFERTGVRVTLSKFLFSGTGKVFAAGQEGKELMESIATPEKLPPWTTEFDLQYHTQSLEKSGWTGGLNYYRCLDKTHELKAPWTEVGLNTRALFCMGDKDLVLKFPGMKDFLDNHFKKFVPNLKDVVVVHGGHFIHQEQPTRINELLIAFLKEQGAPAASPP